MKKGWLEDKRYYSRHGKRYPSVTTILKVVNKPALVQWSANQCAEHMRRQRDFLFSEATRGQEYYNESFEKTVTAAKGAWRGASKKAADIGTEVHSVLHDMAQGLPVVRSQLNPEVQKALEAYDQLAKKEGIVYTNNNEITVYDDDLRVAGTLDTICILSGALTIVDYKASSGIYDEHILQVSKYLDCYNKTTGRVMTRAAIIRLDKKTGKPELFRVKNIEESIRVFNGLVPAYHYIYSK